MGTKLFSLACFVLAAGCSNSDGLERYELQGKVTYGGKPVAMGVVVFEPDGSMGNSGPAGMAEIHDGSFRTAAGKGTVGGPHVARITAGDGKNVSELMPYGNYLGGGEVRLKIDIPKEDAEEDLVIEKIQ